MITYILLLLIQIMIIFATIKYTSIINYFNKLIVMALNNVIIGDPTGNEPEPPKTPSEPNKDTTQLNGNPDTTTIDNNQTNSEPNPATEEPTNITIGDTTLEEGMEIETPDGAFTYKDGNLVDKDGNVFKENKDIKDYIAQFNSSTEPEAFNLSSLQSLLAVDVTDDNGKPIEFTDDETGRKAYIDKVIELKREEASKIALDTFFENNPIVKQFTDFVTAGGDVRYFGQMPDRTGIQFDENNEKQHEAIIKAAWQEFGKHGNVEGYIKYLKDSGGLADAAKEDLKALQDKDNAYKQDIATRAEQARRQEQEDLNNYWKAINDKVNSGIISGYKIPEVITKEVDGKKLNYTRKDFIDYISKVDPQTRQTGYQKDLAALSDDEAMNRELLDAWMHFTGGTYQDIIKMAVKSEEVKRLKLMAKTAKNPSGAIHFNKPKDSKVNSNDIIL